MSNVEFSYHALAQMAFRKISKDLVLEVIANPQEIIDEGTEKVYQSVVEFPDGHNYLLRVFVNVIVQPNKVITVYYTTKIKKYKL